MSNHNPFDCQITYTDTELMAHNRGMQRYHEVIGGANVAASDEAIRAGYILGTRGYKCFIHGFYAAFIEDERSKP